MLIGVWGAKRPMLWSLSAARKAAFDKQSFACLTLKSFFVTFLAAQKSMRFSTMFFFALSWRINVSLGGFFDCPSPYPLPGEESTKSKAH
jgi:hypothetical protein